jgi:hypothetical protein
MCGLSVQEIEAIAAHERVPSILASLDGAERIRQIILGDVSMAAWSGFAPKSGTRNLLRIAADVRGNAMIARQRPKNMCAGAPHRPVDIKPVGDWLIALSCPLAIILAAAIGITATIAVGKNPLRPDRTPAHASGASKDDDYVQGLAKLGIARLPCFSDPLLASRAEACSGHAR